MADKFNAVVIDQDGENFKREIKNLDLNFLNHGEVLVKVDYSDLNYIDALILKNGGKLVKDFPLIPGICGNSLTNLAPFFNIRASL